MDTIIQYIAQIGFPIVAFLLIWAELGKEREAHENETAKLAAVISNNTQALIRLTDKLGADYNINTEGKHIAS